MDLNKFVIDIHVEGVNNTRTKTLPTATPTNIPTLGTRTTSRATSLTKAIPSASSHQPSPTILLTNSTSPRPTSAPTSAATSTKVTTKGRTKIVATINTGCKTTPVPEKSASVTPTTSIPSDDPSNDKESINSKRNNFFLFFRATFTGPFKMASVNVSYLLYQPMDEWNLVVRINSTA